MTKLKFSIQGTKIESIFQIMKIETFLYVLKEECRNGKKFVAIS